MSPVLGAEPIAEMRRASSPARRRPSRSDAQAGGRLTLEQRLDSVWEGLHAGGAPACPVCHAPLRSPRGGATAGCGGCGSILS